MVSNNPHYLSGRKKFEDKDFEGALADYSRSLQDEENPSVYSERAVVYYYLKQLDKSLADMDHAASLEPENPYRYSSRAYIKDAMGDTEGAIQDYEKAVELDPEDSIAYNNLGLLLEKRGYKEKAKENYDRADQLEDVDKLLKRIRKEQKDEQIQSQPQLQSQSQENEDDVVSREEMSIFALLRQTFTTKSGFKEYVAFLRNGFKQR